MARPACTQRSHDALKADLQTFTAATEPLPGRDTDVVMPGGDDGELQIWRNCAACHSTLAYQLWPQDLVR